MQSKINQTMEKEEKNILLKIRSSRACIRDGYQMFTSHFRRIFRHTWILALVYAILTTISKSLAVLVNPTLLLYSIIIETIVTIAFLLAANKVLHKKNFMQKTGKVPAIAWLERFGMVLLVTIVCLFIVSILTMFTSLPTIIMMAANWQSQIGILNGDPAGMPDYVTWLSIAAFMIAGFLQAYVWLSMLCPLYLMRASMALKEQEQQEFNKKNNEEITIH